jgi:hypothetical protein
MPSLLTHSFFAEDFLERHSGDRSFLTADPEAFKIGSQGPDPLFYFSTTFKRGIHFKEMKEKLGSQIHHTYHLEIVRLGCQQLDKLLIPEEVSVFTSFLFGQTAHYLLDSTAHPYVYYWSGFDKTGHLSGKYNYEHAHFEARIDSALAFARSKTELIKEPQDVLALDEDKQRIISENFDCVLDSFAGHHIRENYYNDSLENMRDIYRFVNSRGKFGKALLGHSVLGQLYLPRQQDRTVLNDTHLTWLEPSTGKERKEGFDELYRKALSELERIYAVVSVKGLSYEAIIPYLKGLNYNGIIEGGVNKIFDQKGGLAKE